MHVCHDAIQVIRWAEQAQKPDAVCVCVCVCVVGTMKSAGSENERPKCLDQKMQAHGCCTHRVA